MIRTVKVRNFVMVAAMTIVSVGLSGCDYWPPALQTQIEQLRTELQTVTAEKTQLQNQYASYAKIKEDLQAQVDDLSRANRDKSTMIASLQSNLTSAQERLARTGKGPAPKAAALKASTKAASTKVTQSTQTKQKPHAKKKPAAKSARAH
jgi:outer membrane murein-binding lipoprotein Lpp